MFHGNLRKIVYLTLCAVSNHITMRPDWIAHRDFTPILPVTDDARLAHARWTGWTDRGGRNGRLLAKNRSRESSTNYRPQLSATATNNLLAV
jgi:hypothetical protein